MNRQIRSLAKQFIPKALSIRFWSAYCRTKARRAAKLFQIAEDTPAYLGLADLDYLQHQYPPIEFDYSYDDDTLKQRGQQRAQAIYKLLAQDWKNVNRFLDLGAWDGMTCAALQKMQKQTVGIDIRTEGFSPQAAQSDVSFLQMDAAHLGIPDNTFDCVFSFNSFEHFPDPEKVLYEAIRVVRPGGYIYLDFGPLWWSEKGSHQFKTIYIPYNQCLFSKKQLTTYAEDQGIDLMGFFWMNEWTIDQYRHLWEKVTPQLKKLIYYELLNADHIDLVETYPSCFKSKTDNFENFLVAYIEVLFRKMPNE